MTLPPSRRIRSPRPSKGIPGFQQLLRWFVTGLAFLAPVLLTIIVLAWLFGQLIGFVGPESLFGRVLTEGGYLLTGRQTNPVFGFFVGVLLLMAGITALGFFIKGRAARVFEEAVVGAIGRIPVLGGVYRPVAQLVRGMGGNKTEAMATMAVARVEFGGGVETIAFLASPETFDIGGGPARLVLIPTAPIPVGGALLLVHADKVHTIPGLKFDDLAKLYLTMGMNPPAQMLPEIPPTSQAPAVPATAQAWPDMRSESPSPPVPPPATKPSA